MIVTVTERGEFKRCRQKWQYASHNQQSLQPISVPTALNLGSMIHKTLEMWIHDPDANGPDLFIGVASETKDALEARYLAAVGAPINEIELETFYESVALGRAMIDNYGMQWGNPIPRGFTIVEPEQTMVIPIPGTEHVCDHYFHITDRIASNNLTECPWCYSTNPFVQGIALHYLEATLDFLAQDPNGALWIGEHKTYGQRPRLDHLEVSDQFVAYTWAVTQLGIGPVGGMLYDGLWKRAAPRKGADISELFLREYLSWGSDELATFEIELRREVADMYEAQNNPDKIYRNRRWEGCWDCAFERLCRTEARREDSEYMRQNLFMIRENTKLWAPELEMAEPSE